MDNIDPSTAKQEAKVAAAAAHKNSFEAIAREWLEKHSGAWSQGYKYRVVLRLEKEIFPAIGKRPVKNITAPELLTLLRKIEGRNVNSVAHKIRSDCGAIFRYAIATGRGERDVAADLRGAIKPMPPVKHFSPLPIPQA